MASTIFVHNLFWFNLDLTNALWKDLLENWKKKQAKKKSK